MSIVVRREIPRYWEINAPPFNIRFSRTVDLQRRGEETLEHKILKHDLRWNTLFFRKIPDTRLKLHDIDAHKATSINDAILLESPITSA